MDYNILINQKKKNYDQIISLFENINDDLLDFNLNIYQTDDDVFFKKAKIKDVLYIILNIMNNHHIQPNYSKILEQIFSSIKQDLKENFTDLEIFDIFKDNKRLLLFLFKQGIIKIDNTNKNFIIYKLESKKDVLNTTYLDYFYPEIKPFIDKKKQKIIEEKLLRIDKSIFENYEEKRQKGENQSYLCNLIRTDNIDEFIIIITREIYGIESKIPQSIFETNSFLIEKEPCLIEYAAFFGSIQIIRYLIMNNAKIPPSIWLYAIHSKNAELIHLIEEQKVLPIDKTYVECFIESIKCHHNDFCDYLELNLLSTSFEKHSNNDVESSIFEYHNYYQFNDEFKNTDIFYLMCKFGYFDILILLNFKENYERTLNLEFV